MKFWTGILLIILGLALLGVFGLLAWKFWDFFNGHTTKGTKPG